MNAAPGAKERRPTLARLRAALPARCVQLFEAWLKTGAELAFVAYPSRREVKFYLQRGDADAIARLEWTKRGSGPRLVVINKHTGLTVCASKYGSPWVLDLNTVDLASLPRDEDHHRAVQALRGRVEAP